MNKAVEWVNKQLALAENKLDKIPSWEGKQINNAIEKIVILREIRDAINGTRLEYIIEKIEAEKVFMGSDRQAMNIINGTLNKAISIIREEWGI